MKFHDEAREIWQNQVPANSEAVSMQGETLRVIEKLRDEAKRNGNQNWNADFETLRQFLVMNLGKSDAHGFFAKRKINKDIQRLADYEHPYTNDDLYDRLTDALVEWNRKHPEPVERSHSQS